MHYIYNTSFSESTIESEIMDFRRTLVVFVFWCIFKGEKKLKFLFNITSKLSLVGWIFELAAVPIKRRSNTKLVDLGANLSTYQAVIYNEETSTVVGYQNMITTFKYGVFTKSFEKNILFPLEMKLDNTDSLTEKTILISEPDDVKSLGTLYLLLLIPERGSFGFYENAAAVTMALNDAKRNGLLAGYNLRFKLQKYFSR